MRWYGFSSVKYYVTAGLTLVGVSAASTLLTDRISMAQQPTGQTTKVDDGTEKAIKVLNETLGEDHPKVQEFRKRLEQARDQARKANQAADQARKANQAAERAETAAKRVVVQNADGEVLTEEILGDTGIVEVRRSVDGKKVQVQEVLALPPKEVHGFSLLGNAKQNSELQKALEKYRNTAANEQDKAAAKEKIVSILGEQFDDDMQKRVKQIADLEKKVATLKEQIEKRKEAKQRIIDLRIEVLKNELDGLGFPSSGSSSSFGVNASAGQAALFPTTESRNVFRTFGELALPAPPAPPSPPAPPAP